jgi:teichuronic acid biosynthesis glycosyltransferase TuaC
MLLEGRGIMKYVRGMSRIRKDICRGSYDLVHAHYGLCGLVAHMQDSVPVVVSFMGDDVMGTPKPGGAYTLPSRILVMLSKILARFTDAIIVKSKKLKSTLGNGHAAVIPNGVDFEVFRPMDMSECRRNLDIRAEKKIVLFANDPSIPVKRFELAREAVELARSTVPHVELLTLRNESHSRVPLYMNAADALVLTSFHEGSPNVVKEAMACNLPVISVGVGDVPELCAGVNNCFVCAPEPARLADKLCEVLTNGRRSDGREKLKHLRIETVAQRIVDVYSFVLRKQ